jgi:hypothetical protein
MTLSGHASYSDLCFDSWNYLAVTYRLAAGQQFFNILRTPGYPGYLAILLVLRIPHPIAAAITGQILRMIAATYEVYVYPTGVWRAAQPHASPLCLSGAMASFSYGNAPSMLRGSQSGDWSRASWRSSATSARPARALCFG